MRTHSDQQRSSTGTHNQCASLRMATLNVAAGAQAAGQGGLGLQRHVLPLTAGGITVAVAVRAVCVATVPAVVVIAARPAVVAPVPVALIAARAVVVGRDTDSGRWTCSGTAADAVPPTPTTAPPATTTEVIAIHMRFVRLLTGLLLRARAIRQYNGCPCHWCSSWGAGGHCMRARSALHCVTERERSRFRGKTPRFHTMYGTTLRVNHTTYGNASAKFRRPKGVDRGPR